jgi:predicted ATP-dependent serine protease
MIVKVNQINPTQEPTIKTGQEIFDKWFSRFGGMVIGSAIYVSGTSGAGKSTLMMNIMSWVKEFATCIYSREMTASALKEQVSSLYFSENVHMADEESCVNFDEFMKDIEELKPKIIIIDSLQVIAKEDFLEMSESDACYHIIKKLRDYIKKNNAVLFLIGHNTKEGEFAGKNTIIQMMDAHIDMVYDKKTNARTMSWGQKNRKGPMGSIPYFIDNGKILFENNDISKNNKTNNTTNYHRILADVVGFLEGKIDSINFYKNGDEIPGNIIQKAKRRYLSEKKKNEKYFDQKSIYYYPEIYMENVLEEYFRTIKKIDKID